MPADGAVDAGKGQGPEAVRLGPGCVGPERVGDGGADVVVAEGLVGGELIGGAQVADATVTVSAAPPGVAIVARSPTTVVLPSELVV